MNEIGEIGEGAHEADGEPIANGFADADLILDVVRQVRQRVALGVAAFVGDGFVAARERNGLERKERNLFGIVESELDDVADLFVVDTVDESDDGHDVNAIAPEIFDGAELDVEQVADSAVRVGFVADTVELEVGITKAGFGGFLTEIRGAWRIRYRWWPLGRCCNRLYGRNERRRGSRATRLVRHRRTAPTFGGAA